MACGPSNHLCWRENWIRSAVREFVVLRDRPLQGVVFIAGDETDLLESSEMLFGFRQITLGQMGFTEVFVRAAVPRIEGQSLLIVLHCRIELPQPAISVAKIVLDIRIAGVAKGRIRKSLDRSFPIAGADRSLACCEIGIERCPIRR